jgi:hypothetical protein
MSENQKRRPEAVNRLPLVGPESVKHLFRKESRHRSLRSLVQAHSSMRKCYGANRHARPGVTSDLLIWMKSGRAEFEDQGELGAGKDCLRGIEVSEQFLDGLVVSCLGEMV